MIKGILDSHAHYDDVKFDEDRKEVLQSAIDNGVVQIVNIGISVERSKKSVELAAQYPFMYATVGIHPLDTPEAEENFYEELKELAKAPKVVAIGEIGLDYHYDGYDKETQKEFFRKQMKLAEELGLPVVIHSRDASEDTVNILSEFPNVTGVVHCFSGSAETAKQILKLGYYIGFTGVITYSNARKVVEAAEVVPMDKLLVETDCPYLPPMPHRGKRCSSAMLYLTVERLAEIKKIDAQELAYKTAENARKLFNMPATVF